MSSDLTRVVSPEQRELDRKLAELEASKRRLADVELEAETMRLELADFNRRYHQTVGHLYAQLDDLTARLAERRYQRSPSDPTRVQWRDDARQKADASRREAESFSATVQPEHVAPTDSLKRAYREAAMRIHPDLAAEPNDREYRTGLMAKLNAAYERGDERAVNDIMNEFRDNARSEHESLGDRLVSAIRQIASIAERCDQIMNEIATMKQSSAWKLKERVGRAASYGRDLLAQMCADVQTRIDRLQHLISEETQ